MKLYAITYDGQTHYFEARSMGEAVAIWKAWAKDEWQEDCAGDEEPESVAMVNDEKVFRAGDFDELEFCEGHPGVPASTQDAHGVPLCSTCANDLRDEGERANH